MPSPPAGEEPIVITAPRLAVENLVDRKVYNVGPDVQSTFGSLGDVLTAIPSVDVDPDGIVSLRGDTNVLILIDGKPSTRLSGSAAGDNLQSMPAADIERIEVLTTPPPQFKADGAAGVINIITRKARPQGYAGSLQGSAGSGGRAVAAADLSYASADITATASAGVRHDYRVRRVASDERAQDPVSAQVLDSTSAFTERLHRDVPTADITADYRLDDRSSLNGAASWSERGGLRTYTQSNTSTDPSGALVAASGRASRGHDPEFDYDQRLGYSRKLAAQDEKIDVSLHRSASHQREHYDYRNDFVVPPAPPSASNLELREDRQTTEADVDYALPLARGRSLKAGYAFEQDVFRNGNFGQNIDPATGVALVDPSVTNDFRFTQQINALYGSYQQSADLWTVLGGARAELTRTDTEQLTQGAASRGQYFRLYPSLHVDRSISELSTLSLGASLRVTRPDPSNLDPYVDHEYAPNLRAGNPNLQPQTTQSYDAGYAYAGEGLSGQVTVYYRRNRDAVTDVTQYLGNGVSLTTKANLPRIDANGVEFSADGHIVRALAFSVSGNLFHSQVDASQLGIPGLRSTNGLNAKLKLDYRPTASDSLQLMITRTDKRLTPQGYIHAINVVNAGLRHALRRDLTFVATVSDLFNGQRYQRVASTPTFTADYTRAVQGRIVFAGVVYTFGAAAKSRETRLEYAPAE